MKKRSLMVGLVLATCLLVGCTNGNKPDTNDEKVDGTNKQEESQENGPGGTDESIVGAPEPEEKQVEDEFVWVKDAIETYESNPIRGYEQTYTVETVDGEERTEVLSSSYDQNQGLLFTNNDFGGDKPIQEYYEKTKDGKMYYYSEDFETGKITRSSVEQEEFDRATELSNNTINLDNQMIELVGTTEFADKKAIEVKVCSDNPEYTIFSSIEHSVNEKQMDKDSLYKEMVEKSKESLYEYHLYFDEETKELLGMKVDNSISDFFNNYEFEKIKKSETVVVYTTDEECETINLPKDFKEA